MSNTIFHIIMLLLFAFTSIFALELIKDIGISEKTRNIIAGILYAIVIVLGFIWFKS